MALRDHGAEHSLKALEVINFLPDVSNVPFRDGLHLLAWAASSDEPEERAKIAKRKAQFTAPAHE